MALPAIAVEESIADELVATITELAKERKIGPAYEEDTELGPLVNAGHKDFVLNWIDKSVGEGADLVLDGHDMPAILGHFGRVETLRVTTDANGRASFSLSVPNDPSLVGATLYEQWIVVDPPATLLGVTFSDAFCVTIGTP